MSTLMSCKPPLIIHVFKLNYVSLEWRSQKINTMFCRSSCMRSWYLSVKLWLLRCYFTFSFIMQPCWLSLFDLMSACIVLAIGLTFMNNFVNDLCFNIWHIIILSLLMIVVITWFLGGNSSKFRRLMIKNHVKVWKLRKKQVKVILKT